MFQHNCAYLLKASFMKTWFYMFGVEEALTFNPTEHFWDVLERRLKLEHLGPS